ncbi:MAG: OmpA family protein [Motiliproteus sp.]|nr:OmpA family protein [Motiliproteus sp.]MCW9051403.1 OmpA family protein [Motiliproteus sp.]
MKITRKTTLATFTCVALLSGCQTAPTVQSNDPYTGDKKTSNTAKGAGIGAIAGAVLGAATSSKGDRKKGILTGALVGGAVGGGIGYYMDQQEAELRRYLEGTGVGIQRHGDQIQLVMPGNITFETASAKLAASFYQVLDAVAVVLKKYDQTQLNIDGHTDSQGADSYNLGLSQDRALSVSHYLSGQGIVDSRIKASGYGENAPIADNGTSTGRAANRRVELWIQPLS